MIAIVGINWSPVRFPLIRLVSTIKKPRWYSSNAACCNKGEEIGAFYGRPCNPEANSCTLGSVLTYSATAFISSSVKRIATRAI